MSDTRILIVDDEDVVLKSCLRIFRNCDYDITTCYSAEDALEIIEKEEFDLLISDLKMPGMGGMELLKIIKEKYPDLLTIIFTGYANVETAREALKLGAFDYIPKPFTPEELRDVVNNAVASLDNRSNAEMLDLMAIVSHELKSPVSVVQTTAETLYRGYFGNLDPRHQEIIGTILRNCQYLEDIIRSYIDLSKMEIDDIESFKEDIRLISDVVQPVLEVPEVNKNMKNMNIQTDFPIDPVVEGDANLLEIVIRNLVSNAIKYGKENTDIRISAYEVNGDCEFSVYNEGVGIPEEARDKLFSKFGRLKQKGTEGIKGSGLGLYICKKIIDKHHGTIRADSMPGEWVKFSFKLPTK
jgi:signal transduction histidine kinase